VSGGAIFSNEVYLGAHAREAHLPEADIWSEVALLSEM
jgi:hypothetical protein